MLQKKIKKVDIYGKVYCLKLNNEILGDNFVCLELKVIG